MKFNSNTFSPNDVSAHLYDLVNSKIKPTQLLDREIELIEREIFNLNIQPISILDVGAGTGRHTLKLVEKGYDLTAVEPSIKMIYELKKKINYNFDQYSTFSPRGSLDIINSSIFDYKPQKKFELVILFWNTWNEIALDDELAENLTEVLIKLLAKDGKIILNMDDPELVDFEKMYFETSVMLSEDNVTKHLTQKWKTIKWDDELKKSTALEEIFEVIYDEETQNTKCEKLLTSTIIEQRWYTFEQIKQQFLTKGFSAKKILVNFSDEMYLLISRI